MERAVNAMITQSGQAFKERARSIPTKMGACIPLTREEVRTLLYKVLDAVDCVEEPV